MFKKIVTLLLVAVMVITLVACSSADQNNDDKSETKDKQTGLVEGNDDGDDESNETENESMESISFFGYEISYPEKYSVSDIDFGYTLISDDWVVVIETPAKGIYDGCVSTEVKDLPGEIEEFLLETLGRELRSYFAFGQTSQTITKQTEKNINGIEMAITEGTLYNEKTDTTMNFSAAYMFGGANNNFPVCILGFSRTGDGDVKAAVDTIIENIKKN